jgi:hypothetical protein
VAGDEALDRGEADAVALELPRLVHALEGAEEVRCVLRIEAGAVVAHEDGALPACVGDADLDARRLVLGRGLPGA